ncbi:hypothetical protein Plhal304r1_c016g0058771 [Plasmopara halstedii]
MIHVEQRDGFELLGTFQVTPCDSAAYKESPRAKLYSAPDKCQQSESRRIARKDNDNESQKQRESVHPPAILDEQISRKTLVGRLAGTRIGYVEDENAQEIGIIVCEVLVNPLLLKTTCYRVSSTAVHQTRNTYSSRMKLRDIR